MTEFAGKTVLITGGGSGIGLATAKKLVGADARVVLAGRSADRLKSAAKELDAEEQVLVVPTDVANTDDIDHLISAIRQRFGTLNGVFANAGTALFGRSADASEADFDQTVGTNFKGVFFTIQKSLPLFEDGGSIVINGSWLVHRSMAFTSLYAASKAAVLNLAKSLASDLAGSGIRVNSVSPGYVRTDMFDSISSTEQERAAARSQVVLNRLGQPDDIADAVLFLMSPRAAYVTGQEICVDGGLTGLVPA